MERNGPVCLAAEGVSWGLKGGQESRLEDRSRSPFTNLQQNTACRNTGSCNTDHVSSSDTPRITLN